MNESEQLHVVKIISDKCDAAITLTSAEQIMLLNFNAGYGLSTNRAFVLREVVTLQKKFYILRLLQQIRRA